MSSLQLAESLSLFSEFLRHETHHEMLIYINLCNQQIFHDVSGWCNGSIVLNTSEDVVLCLVSITH